MAIRDYLMEFLLGDRVLLEVRDSQEREQNPGRDLIALILTQAINDGAVCVHFSAGGVDGELEVWELVRDERPEQRGGDGTPLERESTPEARRGGGAAESHATLTAPHARHSPSRWYWMRPIPADLSSAIANELRLIAGISTAQQVGTLWFRRLGRLRRLLVVSRGSDVFVHLIAEKPNPSA
ncbi:MAG TPA: hypothetical protein P5081_02800 [Phycisphaerae bacterium]|nr:hypothetical protein [Phycisphaerae bacterium]HRW51787.1 hypothetical protein [Phycisphaerae bacterium]